MKVVTWGALSWLIYDEQWVCGVQWTAAEAHWIVNGVLIGFFIGYHVEEDVHDGRVDFFVE